MKIYYEDESVTLWHGDCREVLPQLLRTFAAVVTDPPYGINGSSGTKNLERGKSVYANGLPDGLEQVRSIYSPAVVAALALTIDGRGAVTPGTPNAFEYPKPDDMGAILQPASVGLSKWGAATWQPVLFYGRDPFVGKRISPTTYNCTEAAPKVNHPCTKPDGISSWLVLRTTQPGDCILDPFAGAGSFMVAAKRLGRRAVGIEINELYCEQIANRLKQGVLFPPPPPLTAEQRSRGGE